MNHFGTSGSLFGEEDTPHMYCVNSLVATSLLKTSSHLYMIIHAGLFPESPEND